MRSFERLYRERVDGIVDNYAPRDEFVTQLSRYRAIPSTSLHGCIFAHAYGVPVAPFVLTDKVFGSAALRSPARRTISCARCLSALSLRPARSQI